MKRIPVVILVLLLSVLACSQQIATPAPTTPVPTVEVMLTTLSTTVQWTATVRQVQVNVRAEPNGSVVSVVRSGDSVVILFCTGSWCEIEEPHGWVWRGCLSDNPNKLGCTTK